MASVRPISQGVPANLIAVCGDAPVPPVLPEIRITSAWALATPAAIVPIPCRGNQFHADPRFRIDLLQVIDELGQILDRIDIVMRGRRNQGHAGCRVAQLGDEFCDLETGELPAFAGLGALRDLDLDFFAGTEIFRRHAEATRGDLLDRAAGIVAIFKGRS